MEGSVLLTHHSLRTGKTRNHGCGSGKRDSLPFHGAWSGAGSMRTLGRAVPGTLKKGYSDQGAKLTNHHYLGYVEL